MAFFLDSSAVAKCYVQEQGSAWTRQLLGGNPPESIYVARITAVEVVSAITRRKRDGALTAAQASSAITALRSDFSASFSIVEIGEALVDRATALVESHSLRAYDAIQLAAALEIHQRRFAQGLPPLTLVSADAELNAAARAEGVVVDNPNDHP